MSVFDRLRRSRPAPTDGLPDGMVPADTVAARARQTTTAPPAVSDAERELQVQRDQLTERFVMLQTDLGGAFYEMAIRDHIRLDVLTRKAAELQRVDAELAAVEQSLRGSDGRTVGTCPSCGTRHGEHARFCSRCGTALFSLPASAPATPAPPAPTAPVIPMPAPAPEAASPDLTGRINGSGA